MSGGNADGLDDWLGGSDGGHHSGSVCYVRYASVGASNSRCNGSVSSSCVSSCSVGSSRYSDNSR